MFRYSYINNSITKTEISVENKQFCWRQMFEYIDISMCLTFGLKEQKIDVFCK